MQIQTELKRIPFYFIRHGETDWNKQKKLMGHTDIPLNEKGKKQALASITSLKNLNIKHIVSSPLLRARETARIIGDALQISVTENAGLQERNLGVLQGASYNLGDPYRQDIIDDWQGKVVPKGAESWTILEKRTIKAVNDCLELAKPILIVSHGGNYRALYSTMFNEINDIANCMAVYFSPNNNDNHWSTTIIK